MADKPGIKYKMAFNNSLDTNSIVYAIDDAGTFIFRELIENEDQMVTIYFNEADATK